MPAGFVSVVIPCHNQAYFLKDAIESVLAQTHPLREAIVVNDGSTDDTERVVERYPSVRRVSQGRHGLAAARNAGIAVSRGEYLVFLDADDVLLPHAVADGVRCLEAHPESAFVYGKHERITSDGTPLPAVFQPEVRDSHYLWLLRQNFIAVPAAVMFRRSVFDAGARFDASLRACEDYDLYLRLARHHAIHGHAALVALYRQHESNMSRNAARMLSASLAVLRSQRPFLRRDAERRAYREGIKFWKHCYGRTLIRQMRGRAWSDGSWEEFRQGLLTLIRCYPSGIIQLAIGAPTGGFSSAAVRVLSTATSPVRGAVGLSTGRIRADPNPILVPPQCGTGSTTLSWSALGTDMVEVRVDGPGGTLLSRSGPAAEATTGPWVGDGMTFYLQDASSGTGTGLRQTLAAVVVRVGSTRAAGAPKSGWGCRQEHSDVHGGEGVGGSQA